MDHDDPVMAETAGNEEHDLAHRLKAGEERAFEELVRHHGPNMLATTRRILGHPDDAADALQDALLSAFRSIGDFQEQARLSTWLHRVAVNAALMRLRRRMRRIERSIDDLLPSFQDDGHAENPAEPWVEPDLESVENRELAQRVRTLIDELPENHRNVLLLRDIEGLNTAETSALLGLNENTVKIRLHRARQALRGLLDPLLRNPAP